jgi:hypothetical protein
MFGARTPTLSGLRASRSAKRTLLTAASLTVACALPQAASAYRAAAPGQRAVIEREAPLNSPGNVGCHLVWLDISTAAPGWAFRTVAGGNQCDNSGLEILRSVKDRWNVAIAGDWTEDSCPEIPGPVFVDLGRDLRRRHAEPRVFKPVPGAPPECTIRFNNVLWAAGFR